MTDMNAGPQKKSSHRRPVKKSRVVRKQDTAGVGLSPACFSPLGVGGGSVSASQSHSSVSSSVMASSSIMIGSTKIIASSMETEMALSCSNAKESVGDQQPGSSLVYMQPARLPHTSGAVGSGVQVMGQTGEAFWRSELPSVKLGEEMKMHQAKRVALVRAQQAGATGSFKSCDSQFNNFLIPVIPVQFVSEFQSQSVVLE